MSATHQFRDRQTPRLGELHAHRADSGIDGLRERLHGRLEGLARAFEHTQPRGSPVWIVATWRCGTLT